MALENREVGLVQSRILEQTQCSRLLQLGQLSEGIQLRSKHSVQPPALTPPAFDRTRLPLWGTKGLSFSKWS